VEQRGGHEEVAGFLAFGKPRSLQRVLELRHALAAVLDVAVVSEELLDVAEGETHGR
jgi:hypothetical protein